MSSNQPDIVLSDVYFPVSNFIITIPSAKSRGDRGPTRYKSNVWVSNSSKETIIKYVASDEHRIDLLAVDNSDLLPLEKLQKLAVESRVVEGDPLYDPKRADEQPFKVSLEKLLKFYEENVPLQTIKRLAVEKVPLEKLKKLAERKLKETTMGGVVPYPDPTKEQLMEIIFGPAADSVLWWERRSGADLKKLLLELIYESATRTDLRRDLIPIIYDPVVTREKLLTLIYGSGWRGVDYTVSGNPDRVAPSYLWPTFTHRKTRKIVNFMDFTPDKFKHADTRLRTFEFKGMKHKIKERKAAVKDADVLWDLNPDVVRDSKVEDIQNQQGKDINLREFMFHLKNKTGLLYDVINWKNSKYWYSLEQIQEAEFFLENLMEIKTKIFRRTFSQINERTGKDVVNFNDLNKEINFLENNLEKYMGDGGQRTNTIENPASAFKIDKDTKIAELKFMRNQKFKLYLKRYVNKIDKEQYDSILYAYKQIKDEKWKYDILKKLTEFWFTVSGPWHNLGNPVKNDGKMNINAEYEMVLAFMKHGGYADDDDFSEVDEFDDFDADDPDEVVVEAKPQQTVDETLKDVDDDTDRDFGSHQQFSKEKLTFEDLKNKWSEIQTNDNELRQFLNKYFVWVWDDGYSDIENSSKRESDRRYPTGVIKIVDDFGDEEKLTPIHNSDVVGGSLDETNFQSLAQIGKGGFGDIFQFRSVRLGNFDFAVKYFKNLNNIQTYEDNEGAALQYLVDFKGKENYCDTIPLASLPSKTDFETYTINKLNKDLNNDKDILDLDYYLDALSSWIGTRLKEENRDEKQFPKQSTTTLAEFEKFLNDIRRLPLLDQKAEMIAWAKENKVWYYIQKTLPVEELTYYQEQSVKDDEGKEIQVWPGVPTHRVHKFVSIMPLCQQIRPRLRDEKMIKDDFMNFLDRYNVYKLITKQIRCLAEHDFWYWDLKVNNILQRTVKRKSPPALRIDGQEKYWHESRNYIKNGKEEIFYYLADLGSISYGPNVARNIRERRTNLLKVADPVVELTLKIFINAQTYVKRQQLGSYVNPIHGFAYLYEQAISEVVVLENGEKVIKNDNNRFLDIKTQGLYRTIKSPHFFGYSDEIRSYSLAWVQRLFLLELYADLIPGREDRKILNQCLDVLAGGTEKDYKTNQIYKFNFPRIATFFALHMDYFHTKFVDADSPHRRYDPNKFKDLKRSISNLNNRSSKDLAADIFNVWEFFFSPRFFEPFISIIIKRGSNLEIREVLQSLDGKVDNPKIRIALDKFSKAMDPNHFPIMDFNNFSKLNKLLGSDTQGLPELEVLIDIENKTYLSHLEGSFYYKMTEVIFSVLFKSNFGKIKQNPEVTHSNILKAIPNRPKETKIRKVKKDESVKTLFLNYNEVMVSVARRIFTTLDEYIDQNDPSTLLSTLEDELEVKLSSLHIGVGGGVGIVGPGGNEHFAGPSTESAAAVERAIAAANAFSDAQRKKDAAAREQAAVSAEKAESEAKIELAKDAISDLYGKLEKFFEFQETIELEETMDSYFTNLFNEVRAFHEKIDGFLKDVEIAKAITKRELYELATEGMGPDLLRKYTNQLRIAVEKIPIRVRDDFLNFFYQKLPSFTSKGVSDLGLEIAFEAAVEVHEKIIKHIVWNFNEADARKQISKLNLAKKHYMENKKIINWRFIKVGPYPSKKLQDYIFSTREELEDQNLGNYYNYIFLDIEMFRGGEGNPFEKDTKVNRRMVAQLMELGYYKAEARDLDPETAATVIDRSIARPPDGVPGLFVPDPAPDDDTKISDEEFDRLEMLMENPIIQEEINAFVIENFGNKEATEMDYTLNITDLDPHEQRRVMRFAEASALYHIKEYVPFFPYDGKKDKLDTDERLRAPQRREKMLMDSEAAVAAEAPDPYAAALQNELSKVQLQTAEQYKEWKSARERQAEEDLKKEETASKRARTLENFDKYISNASSQGGPENKQFHAILQDYDEKTEKSREKESRKRGIARAAELSKAKKAKEI